jgi:ketosteroid isomerase-like protein
MATALPEVITHYFEADARRDVDGVVALFTDDAVVVDERKTWTGTDEIRAWRVGPASLYRYTTDLHDRVESRGDSHLLSGRLTGNFPGGTAQLKWRFTVAGQRISRLHIAPSVDL